jgi:hypothetical protein
MELHACVSVCEVSTPRLYIAYTCLGVAKQRTPHGPFRVSPSVAFFITVLQ